MLSFPLLVSLCVPAADLFPDLPDVRFDFDVVDFELDPLPSGLRLVGRFEAKLRALEPQRNHAPNEQQEDEEQICA